MPAVPDGCNDMSRGASIIAMFLREMNVDRRWHPTRDEGFSFAQHGYAGNHEDGTGNKEAPCSRNCNRSLYRANSPTISELDKGLVRFHAVH